MTESCIIAPLPQFDVEPTEPAYHFPPNFVIRPIWPELRRALLDRIKAEEPLNNKMLGVIIDSSCVIMAQVPPGCNWGDNCLSGALYSTAANIMLKRLVDCFRLWHNTPDPFDTFPWSCWFFVEGPIDKLALDSIMPLRSDWECPAVYPTGWTLTPAAAKVSDAWDKLAELTNIAALNEAFSNKDKQQEYFDAGNANIKLEAEKMAIHRVREIGEEDLPGPGEPVIHFTEKFSVKALVDGYLHAYGLEVDKIREEYYSQCSANRFPRAFQIFVSSHRVDEPFRFLALATCLESLLSLGNAELSFQLASRVAWLLEPEDSTARMQLFDEVKKLYALRSKIVHGAKYDADELDEEEASFLDIVRRTLRRILFDDDLYEIFFKNTKKECDKFLKKLSLGAYTRAQ